MGYYIELPSNINKAGQLIRDHNAIVRSGRPVTITDLADGKVLVCVVQNGMFDAAGIVFSDDELEAFSQPTDPRPRTWLAMDRDEVVRLCPHVKDVLSP